MKADRRPCHCDRVLPGPYTVASCRLCWLYHNDADYRRHWDDQGGDSAILERTIPCIFLGEVLERNCPCPAKWIRQCEVYGRCSIEHCKTCPDYEAAE